VKETGDSAQLLLKVKNLKIHFELREGTVRAVEDVSFRLRRRKTLGVIGESGCGKSVTAQAILRIVPIPPGKELSGEILFYSTPPGQQDQSELDLLRLDSRGDVIRAIRGKEISMIFQEPMTSFSPVHSIGFQIIEAIRLHEKIGHQEAKARAVELLKKVGIAKPEMTVDSYQHQLSGGMRQRAMIAMALACGPKLLIADEPTTALDVTIQAQILDLLKGLQEESGMMSIMYISHDLAVVGEVADEIMVMYLGRVMEYASADELFDNPLHPYTQALFRSIPEVETWDEELFPIAGSLPGPYMVITGCPFFSRCVVRIEGECNRVAPSLSEVSPGHMVSCLHYSKKIEKADVPAGGIKNA
jgi:peptide/nickel transport system ATP-binding protein